MSVIEVSHLTKRFGPFTAVDDLNLRVEEGEIFGFLGPNGAGKSTTIKMLATLLKPSAGSIRLAGYDVLTEPDRVRASIGLVFQDPSLDDRLTASENLAFHAMMYGIPRRDFPARERAVLEMVDLLDRRNALVKTFSGGMKRRLEIARGLLHHPQVLFLDEPTVGLDPQTRAAIWEHVLRLPSEEGTTVFMTTHYLDEAENCDRIAIIDHGRIQDEGSPEALKHRVGGDVLRLQGPEPEILGAEIAQRYGLEVRSVAGALELTVPDGASFVPGLAAEFAGRIEAIEVRRPTLDDVFLQLTGRAIREEEGSTLESMRLRRRAFQGRRG